MTLYHFTCSHGYSSIGSAGLLRPMTQVAMPVPYRLVWLTDLDVCDKRALGLQSEIVLTCDRSEYRYRVDDDGDVETFDEWADSVHLDRSFRSALMFGRKPRHWFVSMFPVPVSLAAGKDKP